MRRILLAAAGLIFLTNTALADGTITITTNGFSILSKTPPDGWPEGIEWPGGKPADGNNPNGTATATMNDADFTAMMAWMAANYFVPNTAEPPVPTAAEVVVAWIRSWLQGSIDGTQRHHTAPPIVPPPIEITGGTLKK